MGETADPSGDDDGVRKLVSSLPVDHAGTTVFVKGWHVEQTARAPVVIVHDLGEQATLYRETALTLARHGHSVYSYDLRGHGRSGRRLGHAPSFNVLIKDLLQVAAWARHKEHGRAPVLLGHGIGALIALSFAQDFASFCHGIILSAPSFELATPVPVWMRLLIKALAEISPTLRLPAFACPRFIRESRSSQLESTGETDRIVYFPRLTAIFADALVHAIKAADSGRIDYKDPVLVLCPENDVICSYAQLKKAAAMHGGHNLVLADLPNVGHDVFVDGETNRQEALRCILPWLAQLQTAEKIPGSHHLTLAMDDPASGQTAPETAIP